MDCLCFFSWADQFRLDSQGPDEILLVSSHIKLDQLYDKQITNTTVIE